MSEKKRINMLSSATSVDGQGVGSAYLELMGLLETYGKDDFEIQINKGLKNCDLIHVHTVEPANYFKLRSHKKPSVCYVHFLPDTLDGSIRIPKPFFRFFKRYVLKFYNSADHLVVVNSSFKKEMIKYGLDGDKITYIPNFVSKKSFYEKSEAEKRAAREKYNFPADKFIALGCGQVQTRKGVEDFVKVAEMLSDIQFVWAGGFSFGAVTDGYNRLKKIVDDPPANVTFTGILPRSEMNDIFNACDLLFMPSYNELFPMTILESASTNTPFLLRDIELYEEILFKKYVCAGDNEGFASMIRRFADDKEFYREQIGNAAYISDYYSEPKIYAMWKKFYLDCIENARAAELP